MLQQRLEAKWIDVFCQAFALCGVRSGESAAILSETQSRPVNVQLAELALLRMGARAFHLFYDKNDFNGTELRAFAGQLRADLA